MRIATWNVNSLKVRMDRVPEWLAYAQPDVLCLQETKLADATFPHLAFAALGYESVHHGSGQWNGVAILSRVGLEDPLMGFPEADRDPDTRLITATCGGVRVCSAYVPNGRTVGSEHYAYKLDWLARLRRHLAGSRQAGRPGRRLWRLQHRPSGHRCLGSQGFCRGNARDAGGARGSHPARVLGARRLVS